MNNRENPTQNIVLTDRCRLEINGVLEVDSFTDNSVIAESVFGDISVDGEELKIDSFSTDTGKLSISGKIDGFFFFAPKGIKKKKN